jgi:hypothetical protein
MYWHLLVPLLQEVAETVSLLFSLFSVRKSFKKKRRRRRRRNQEEKKRGGEERGNEKTRRECLFFSPLVSYTPFSGSSTAAAMRRWLVDNLDKKGFEELRNALVDVRREKKLPHIDEVRDDERTAPEERGRRERRDE